MPKKIPAADGADRMMLFPADTLKKGGVTSEKFLAIPVVWTVN
jgi:hypothetical protein